MEIGEAINQARLYANRASRMARILARLKPLIQATATKLDLSADEEHIRAEFICQDDHCAWKLGQALHLNVVLVYSGSSATKHACYEIDDLRFDFMVHTVRLITIDDCRLVRRKQQNGTVTAILDFNGLELVKLKMWDALKGRPLKEKLFKMVAEGGQGRYKRDSYRFVLKPV